MHRSLSKLQTPELWIFPADYLEIPFSEAYVAICNSHIAFPILINFHYLCKKRCCFQNVCCSTLPEKESLKNLMERVQMSKLGFSLILTNINREMGKRRANITAVKCEVIIKKSRIFKICLKSRCSPGGFIFREN